MQKDYRTIEPYHNMIEKLKSYMDRVGIKKAYLARQLGVSKSYISMIFSYEKIINIQTFLRICDIINCESILDFKEK